MGLASWVALGLLLGLVARRFAPWRDGAGRAATLAVAACGAIGGGLAATLIDAGGLAALDWTSAAAAALAAALALVLLAVAIARRR